MIDVLRRPRGYLKGKVRAVLDTPSFKKSVAEIERADYCEKDLRENETLLARFREVSNFDVRTINWFLPYVKGGYAGIRTLLRFMDYFHRSKRVENRVVIYDKPNADPDRIKSTLAGVFPQLQNFEVFVLKNGELDALPACDVAVATLWTSAYQVLKFKKATGKFYFIQDYEPLFYPAGSLYALAEATHRFGFYSIVNSPGLWEFYQRQYSSPGTYFTPAVDKEIFHPPASRIADGKFRLFFYGRLGAARNAYELGVLAIRRLKEKWGDKLEVYVAGSPSQLTPRSRKTPIFQNLGFLPYAKTGDLYRGCDAGLVFMMTPHCSYIPLELMGCGAAVVSNRNQANSWLYRHGENCLLSEPSISDIVENISKLIEDPSLTKRLSANGFATVAGLSWEPEMEKVLNFICRRDEH
jgi:O-antigen biosynthesis protein